jgi:dolichol kinase
VEGTAAFLITGVAVLWAFPALAFGPALAGVVVAAAVEAAPLPVNDNIRVPLAAALVVAIGEALLLDRPLHLFASLAL